MASFGEGTAVKTIQVQKSRLQTALTTNLETHKKEFQEALEGYYDAQTQAIAALSRATSKGQGRENVKHIHELYREFSDLERPVDHSKDYEQAISLMDYEIRDIIELSINDFECYVNDNWNWKGRFQQSFSKYSPSGR